MSTESLQWTVIILLAVSNILMGLALRRISNWMVLHIQLSAINRTGKWQNR